MEILFLAIIATIIILIVYSSKLKDDKTKDKDTEIKYKVREQNLTNNLSIFYKNNGNVYFKKGEYDKAIENYNKAVKLNPYDFEIYYSRGKIYYFFKSEYNKAIKDFSKAIELNPSAAELYNNRGLVYYYKEEYDKAIEDYNKAVKLKPDFAICYNNLGNAYIEKGNYDKAIENYTKAVELEPNELEYQENRENAFLKKLENDRSKGKAVPLLHNRRLFYVLDLEQGTKEWLEWRHSGIGASDAPTIMNENRFQSPSELLKQKKNKINTKPNEAMRTGTLLEPEARDLYIKETGIFVKPLCIQSKKYSWLIASLDGISENYDHIVEIKCGKSAYRQAVRGIVPSYYYGQLQHQLMITGLNSVDYWCYWPGEKPILLTVKRDDSYIKRLLRAEQKFMEKLHN